MEIISIRVRSRIRRSYVRPPHVAEIGIRRAFILGLVDAEFAVAATTRMPSKKIAIKICFATLFSRGVRTRALDARAFIHARACLFVARCESRVIVTCLVSLSRFSIAISAVINGYVAAA